MHVTGSHRGMTAAQAWVLALTSVSSLMVALDALVVTTALPAIRVQLHASLAELEWTVNAYVLSLAVLLMTGAALGDRFGRRRMFAAGMGLFTAASAACALAPGIGWLIAARAVQGAGAAVMLPVGLALLSAGFPPERRAWALGIFGAVTGLGVVLGPLVGGAAVQGLSWPWIFWINVPIGLITSALTRARVAESWGPRSSPGSFASAPRCCRCACSARARSPRAMRRSSCCGVPRWALCSSWRSSCRSACTILRWPPGCG